MKISSRAGRFKKKLVSLENLQLEAPLIVEKMAPFLELHEGRQISDAEFCGIFIVISLSIRSPVNWLGSKRPSLNIPHKLNFSMDSMEFDPNIKKRLTGMKLGDIFANFALKSTPEPVNRALLSWSNGNYPLELMFRIPRPIEVLEQQRHGRRVLTILLDRVRISEYILGERDYLSFTMHDLIHADHFYHHNDCYQGQLGFYGLLHRELSFFDELLKNTEFRQEFEYFISDMNAYAIHLLKCLKSAMIYYVSQEVFERWIKDFPVKESLLLLNTANYVPEDHDHLILQWLQKFVATLPNQQSTDYVQ